MELSKQFLEKDTSEMVCPLCKGIEWLFDREKNLAMPCQCQEQARMNRRLKIGNLPPLLREANLENFKVEYYQSRESKQLILLALQEINIWLEEPEQFFNKGIGLYLYSDIKGSGKTRMAASIANYLMLEKQISVKFATTLQIINEIKNTWGEDSGSESRLLDALATVKVLIIDDLGVEMNGSKKAWVEDKFYHIINERSLKQLPTIYTSNLPMEQLPYQDRITSRIDGMSIRVAFPEESIRKTKSNEYQAQMIEQLKIRIEERKSKTPPPVTGV